MIPECPESHSQEQKAGPRFPAPAGERSDAPSGPLRLVWKQVSADKAQRGQEAREQRPWFPVTNQMVPEDIFPFLRNTNHLTKGGRAPLYFRSPGTVMFALSLSCKSPTALSRQARPANWPNGTSPAQRITVSREGRPDDHGGKSRPAHVGTSGTSLAPSRGQRPESA